jgi:hypothetical protein
MDGVKNLAQQSVAGAAKEAAKAKTMEQIAKGAGGAGIVAGAVGGPYNPVAEGLGGATAIATGLRGLMLSAAGRRILSDASVMRPGNPELQKLLDSITTQIPAAGARAATQ